MGTRQSCRPSKTHEKLNLGTDPSSPRPATAREIVCWCLPALLIGLALRIALTAYMPLAFLSPDTNEFISSRLFGGSRTFLPKLIYDIPVRLGLPLLSTVAVLQHLFGLIMIVASGFLCERWLRRWRWWIVPFTCIIAVHPTLLWYEHFALPDSTFTCLLILAFLAGSRFYRQPTPLAFGVLFGTLLLVAGARQEGFLFLAFGVALTVRAYWGDVRRMRVFLPVAVLLAFGIALITRTNQGGYMLLTSLIQWAPDQLRCEPGLSARVVTLREHFKPQWPAYPEDHNTSRKLIVEQVEDYLATERGVPEKERRNRTEALCKKVSFEVALGNFWRLPGLVFNKFRASHLESPSSNFGPEWAYDKQLRIFFGKADEKPRKEHKMMKLYLGREYASREEMEADLPRLYRILPGDRLSHFQKAFYAAEYAFPWLPTQNVGPQTLPGLPLLYLLTTAGFLAIVWREGRALSERQMWIAMLVFQAFVIFLTGSLRSRYRLSFEPWFFLGLFAFLDSLVGMFGGKSAPSESARVEPLRTEN